MMVRALHDVMVNQIVCGRFHTICVTAQSEVRGARRAVLAAGGGLPVAAGLQRGRPARARAPPCECRRWAPAHPDPRGPSPLPPGRPRPPPPPCLPPPAGLRLGPQRLGPAGPQRPARPRGAHPGGRAVGAARGAARRRRRAQRGADDQRADVHMGQQPLRAAGAVEGRPGRGHRRRRDRRPALLAAPAVRGRGRRRRGLVAAARPVRFGRPLHLRCVAGQTGRGWRPGRRRRPCSRW
jgi:hypothetical protein